MLANGKEKAAAIDFLNEVWAKDVDFYQAILESRGAVGTLKASSGGAAYSAPDAFFGGDTVWQKFSEWMGKVPSVSYGMFTYEGEAAMASQLPALMQGTPTDKILENIHNQLAAQVK